VLLLQIAEVTKLAMDAKTNPVKGGLALNGEEFPWSSARPIANRPQVNNLPHMKEQSVPDPPALKM